MTTRIPPKSKRRFLRFTLSSLLLLMLVVCVALGWKVERVRKQREAVNWVQRLGGSVQYDYQIDDNNRLIPNAESPGPKWLMKQLGIDFFDDVVCVVLREATQVSDVTPLSGLKSLRTLMLDATQVSDVTPLSGLKSLEWLWLGCTPVSDVTPLAGLTKLEVLGLDDTQVSDVTPLSGLTKLKELGFDSTQVSDVTPLSGLKSLKRLRLSNSHVKDVTAFSGLTSLEELSLEGIPLGKKAMENLSRALPECLIKSGRTNQ